jgi:hypothetical protein
VMGEWEMVKVPPADAKRDKGCPKMALKPGISALKKVYEIRKKREGAKPGWQYPKDSELIESFNSEKGRIRYQDFRSVLTPARETLKKADRAASKAATKAVCLDQGGLGKLKEAYEKAEKECKEKSKGKQEEWSARDKELDDRLATANDVLVRAPPGATKEEAQLAVENLQEEHRNFLTARSLEKKALDEARAEVKRKYDSDLQKQKTHNQTVKGESRKKFKVALASAEPMHVECAVPAADVSATAVSIAIGAAARARDPDLQLAAELVRAVIADALAATTEPQLMEVDGV